MSLFTGQETGRDTGQLGFRRSVFGKAGIDTSQFKAGATFARTGARDVVETAKIISVHKHAGGVSHVHYACRLQHASRVLEAGPRTLALQTFAERFDTQLSDAQAAR